MLTPTTYSRGSFFMPNPRGWITCSISLLFIIGLPVTRVESGPSPAVVLSASHWTPIGPAPVNGPFAGRIDVAAPDPSNSNVMYLGGNNSGIWKTINWSASSPTWTAVSDKPAVQSLAVHEHDLVVFPGNSNIVLAAASGPGGGILRSDDGGSTWSFLGNSSFDKSEFGAIVVDPNVANAQTLYVAVSAGSANFFLGSGLYKSTDGGATWSDAAFLMFSGHVSDLLEIQEGGQTVLYAADTQNAQANGGAVYRSPDGGVTWTLKNLPTKTAGYLSIRLVGSTAPTEQIYASAIDASHLPNDPYSGVVYRFVTSDQGTSWTQLQYPDANGPDTSNSGTSHRSHHNVIAADPAHSNIVFVNTDIEILNTKNPDGSSKYDEWIWKSIDSGVTWTRGIDGGGDPVSGSFDGTGVFVVTSDGGIHLDPVNVGANKGGNLDTIEFYGFSLDALDTRKAYGLFQDGPGVLKYVGMLDWQYFQPPNVGEAGKIRVDPSNSNRVYLLDPNPTDPVNAPTSAARFIHSTDGGQMWQPAITGLPTVVSYASGNPVTVDYASFPGKGSIVIDPNNGQRLLLGFAYFKDKNNVETPGSVFETITGGDPNNADPKFNGNGWRNVGSDLASYKVTISALALAPSAANTSFAGTEDGRVFKTTNAGNNCNPNCPTWTEVDSGLPQQNQRVMALVIDPNNPDHDFAVTSPFLGRDDTAPDYSGFNHVWMRNGGAWSQINGDLPTKLGGETLAVDWQPATPVLYIGTLRGGYVSTNLGTNWTRMSTLPRTRITDLDFMPNLHLLGAGTMGWGAWEILTQSTPPTVVAPASQMSIEGATHLFSLGSFSDPDGGPWSVDINWGDGTSHTTFTANSAGPLPAQNHKYAEEGPYTVTIAVTDTLDGQSDSKNFAVDVSDPPVNASGGFIFQANVGTNTGPQAVATFTDPGGAEPNSSDPTPATSAGHYTASIDWGDGTNSPGDITPLIPSSSSQIFTVTGNHTYTTQSPVSGFNVITTINHEGVISMAISTAIVGRAGTVIGGGQIGSGRNFSFDVRSDLDGFTGNLTYKDKTNNIDLMSTSITFISILSDNAHATFNGPATVNGISGYTFRVDVEDNADPVKGKGKGKGKGVDRFRIQFNGPTNYDSNAFAANGGLLTAGTIEIH